MFKGKIETESGLRVVLMDSIAQVTDEDAGAIVVAGSHGGVSAAEYAMRVPLRLVCFNDAGVGKDTAGIRALSLLEAGGVAALAVAHDTACIGDARDAWESGVIAHLNAGARALGLRTGTRLREAILGLEAPGKPE